MERPNIPWALCKDDEKRKVTANCHGIENMGWIDDRKMRCASCGVMAQCMWGPLDEGHVSLHDSDPYGPICFKCCACDRPPPYNYIEQVLRSNVDGSKITGRVAEYGFEACALYARWLQIYSMGLEFQDEHPILTPRIAEAPSRQEAVQEALPAFEARAHMPIHETFLARTSTPLAKRILAPPPHIAAPLPVHAPPPFKAPPPVKAPPTVKAPPPWLTPTTLLTVDETSRWFGEEAGDVEQAHHNAVCFDLTLSDSA